MQTTAVISQTITKNTPLVSQLDKALKVRAHELFTPIESRESLEQKYQMLDAYPDKNLIFVRDRITRLSYYYNDKDCSTLVFRFEADEKTAAKLVKVHMIPYFHGKGRYHKAGELTIGGEPALLWAKYCPEDGCVVVSIADYPTGSNAEAIEKMREVLSELEKVIRNESLTDRIQNTLSRMRNLIRR